MRVQTGSKHTSSGSSAVQFFTSDEPKLTWIKFKARSGNDEPAYITTSSGAASTSGWEFSLFGDDDMPPIEATVKATTYWMRCASTTAVIDWVARWED